MAMSGNQITRLAPHATPTRKNGSFAGKEATEAGAVPYKGFLVNTNRMGIRTSS